MGRLKVCFRRALLFLSLFALFPATALAEAGFDYTVEQAQVRMPDITVFYNSDSRDADWESAAVAAALDGESLEVLEHTLVNESGDEALYIFLVDCSTSVTYPQIEGIKEALRLFSREKAPAEKMALISFGERVSTVLEGGETQEEIDLAIDGLRNSQDGTVLFDAVNQAVTYSENAPDSAPLRKVAVLFTDAEDFAVGSYTHYELQARLTGESIPLYAVGFNTGTKDSLDALGVLARSSGGGIHIANYDEIGAALDGIAEKVRGARKIVLRAATNEVSFQEETLTIQLGLDGAVVSKEVAVVPKRFVPDVTPPAITGVESMSGNALKVTFSEPVLGAGEAGNFLVGDGAREFGVLQATYLSDENAVLLLLEQVLEDVECTVTCLGITDRSQEKNILSSNTASLIIGDPSWRIADDGDGTAVIDPVPEANLAWVPFAVIGLAALTVLIILAARRSRAVPSAESAPSERIPGPAPAPLPPAEARHGFTARNAAPLRLIVTDRSGTAHQVDLRVTGSIFVGSSAICNLHFDDPRLAPQHFAIEARDGMFFVQDLGGPGGTLVNGVPVVKPRRLEERDIITAGQETFVFMGPPA